MPATQIDRPFRLKTPLGSDALLLESFTGSERISSTYRYSLRVLSPDPNIDIKGLLGKPVVVTFELTDVEAERHIHGHVSRMRLLEYGDDNMAMYEMEIVPWPWFLNHFSDCRIFQNKTVPQIIEAVFKDRGFSDYQLKLTGSYEPREYCVQYRETDFNFISRLMEDEGIFYFFRHDNVKHTLVLADAPTAFEVCPNKSKARYMPSSGGRLDEDTVIAIEDDFKVTTRRVSLVDYDFEKPNTSLYATIDGTDPAKGEYYDYPAIFKTKDQGDHYTRIRLEEREVETETIRGRSNCMAFEAGYKFTLEDYIRQAANQAYTLLAVEHSGRNTSYRSGSSEPFRYSNFFEAIPASVPFRPPRMARRPRIHGTQTAVVVGKSGEEIWTDQYGRVVVQFFWDRQGKADENSSCWIRVAQGWAGKQWGAIHIPRIGQEVVVSFLEGDPDRPLITGSVYNADQTVPYTLPGEQTKSTLKSMSTKGGGGFNEIRIEDKKDSEEIFIHAQKDYHQRVKNDRKEWIGKDRHLIVNQDKFQKVTRDVHVLTGRDEVKKITRDRHLNIQGKSAVAITGSSSLKVTGDVIEEFKANHSSQVTQSLYLKALQVVVEASTGLTLKVGGSFITIDPSGVAIKGPMVQINSAGAALSGSPGALVAPIDPTEAQEAVQADPGAVTSAPKGSPQSRVSLANLSISPDVPPPPPPAPPPPTHDPNAEENREKTHWIEVELQDEAGQPVAGEKFRIILPNGSVYDGTLDDKGRARVPNIDPGTCQVTFPNLDKDAWKPK